ncbi:MAG: hypothetical protein ACRDO0_04110, partial [Nocardioidaceae bacterium]
TWAGGRLVARLLREGKRVGVASTSHKAIHKLLDEVVAGADELGLDLQGCKKASGDNPESFYEGEGIENLTRLEDCLDWPLTAGTAWLFADGRFDQELDYLFIDEGGQVSLADALAMGTCARNLVLLGDPLQLGQVLQGQRVVVSGGLGRCDEYRTAGDECVLGAVGDVDGAHPTADRAVEGALRGVGPVRGEHDGVGGEYDGTAVGAVGKEAHGDLHRGQHIGR